MHGPVPIIPILIQLGRSSLGIQYHTNSLKYSIRGGQNVIDAAILHSKATKHNLRVPCRLRDNFSHDYGP